MRSSLRSKLSFSYALISLILVALISFGVNVLLQNQFKNYVIRQQETRNVELVVLVENQYDRSDSNWNVEAIENIGVNALEQGVILKVRDNADNTVWDATIHNNGLCVQMLNHMADNMQSRNRGFKGGYEQKEYPMSSDGEMIGHIEIGYYGPYYFTDSDIVFLNSVNQILLAVGILSLVMALIVGSFMAKRILSPISESINAADEIAKGNFSRRIAGKSGSREIVKLTDTINHLADSLENQQTLRKRMAADVAHELRTPLANLQSSLEAMIDGVWEPDTDRLQSCHEEIMRLNRLVGDLEKLERFEAQDAYLDISEFDLSDLVKHILTNFEPEFHKKDVSLHFSGDMEILKADRDKLSQVVINLVSNALKYTSQGGHVDVAVSDFDNQAVLTVKDNGEGIRSEDIPFLFERFYRADKSRSRLTGGLGLGLAITKAIVEAHKGTISVRSEPGKGSVFTVILPK